MAQLGAMAGPARVFNEAQQADIAAMIYVSVGKSNNVTDLPSFRPTSYEMEQRPRYGQYHENHIKATSHVHEDAATKAARRLPVRLEVNPSRVAQLLSLEALPWGCVGFQELIVTILSGTSYKVMSAFFNKNIPEFRLDFIFPVGRQDYALYIRRYKHHDGQRARFRVKVRVPTSSPSFLSKNTLHFESREAVADAFKKADMLGPLREPLMWEEYECSVQGQAGSIFGDAWTPWDSCARGRARAGATPDNQMPDDIFIQMLNDDTSWDLVRKGNGTIQENETGFFVIPQET